MFYDYEISFSFCFLYPAKIIVGSVEGRVYKVFLAGADNEHWK